MASAWVPIGTCRRTVTGDALRIDIPDAHYGAHLFGIPAESVDALLSGTAAKIIQLDASGHSCGWATWSRSGTMILLDVPGSGAFGVPQIVGADLKAHWRRGERQPVPVVVKPKEQAQDVPRALPKNVRWGVV